MSQFVTIAYPDAGEPLLAWAVERHRRGGHESDQSSLDLERSLAGRDSQRSGAGLAPRRARAFRRRDWRSVLSLVLPSLLPLLLSPGRRSAGRAADVYRARGCASCAGAAGYLVLLRRIQDLLSVRQGMPRRLAARDAAAGARRLTQVTSIMKLLRISPLLIGVLLRGACVSMPKGPSVMVLPGSGKSFDQFHYDDVECRNFAEFQVGGKSSEDIAAESAAKSAVVGTAIGAAAGAALGGRSGAAAGAGGGLLPRPAAGARGRATTTVGTQRRTCLARLPASLP